jgi:hypothetical protein
MKDLKSVLLAGILGTVVATPGLAAVGPDPVVQSFGSTLPELERVQDSELGQYRGRFAPMLVLPLSIVAADLALIGTFWGVYVHMYDAGSTTRVSAR